MSAWHYTRPIDKPGDAATLCGRGWVLKRTSFAIEVTCKQCLKLLGYTL